MKIYSTFIDYPQTNFYKNRILFNYGSSVNKTDTHLHLVYIYMCVYACVTDYYFDISSIFPSTLLISRVLKLNFLASLQIT